VGQRDWLLRLYQHVGVTESSLIWGGFVLYDPEQEWPLIQSSIDWIEIVFRIAKKEAVAAGREIETPDGLRIGVPLAAYSAHERD
jgi:hypothetical protein